MARIRYHLLEASTAAPPSAAGKSSNSYAADANFDSNMVIILAALLCALICALGLNSIVRCALRCGQRFSFEVGDPGVPGRAGARIGSRGLKKEALSQIPVAAYAAGGRMGIAAEECPICLGEFVEGEKVRVLPECRHGFHVKCIDTWLDSHSSCPICRQLLLFDSSGAGNRGNSGEDGQV